MKWTIGICTLPNRRSMLSQLLAMLRPQIERYPRDIELAIVVSDRLRSLGENRQHLVDHARSTYFNIIDDDDLVAPDYVDSIYPLLDGIDYVGFQLQMYVDGAPSKPTYHSLRYDRWWEDDAGYYRDISHLNPMRMDLVRRASFAGGWAEDFRWANDLRRLHCVEREHYVDKVMYHYYYRTKKND